MSKSMLVCAASLLLAGVLVLVVADELAGSLTLTVDRNEEAVFADGTIGGLAGEATGGFVSVTMYIDGTAVEEDEVMDGSHNEFDFDIPADAAGKTLTIQAVRPQIGAGPPEKTGNSSSPSGVLRV